MKVAVATAALLLVLAGCGSGGGRAARTTSTQATTGPTRSTQHELSGLLWANEIYPADCNSSNVPQPGAEMTVKTGDGTIVGVAHLGAVVNGRDSTGNTGWCTWPFTITVPDSAIYTVTYQIENKPYWVVSRADLERYGWRITFPADPGTTVAYDAATPYQTK